MAASVMTRRQAVRTHGPLSTRPAYLSALTAPITTDVVATQVTQARPAAQAPCSVMTVPAPLGDTHEMIPSP